MTDNTLDDLWSVQMVWEFRNQISFDGNKSKLNIYILQTMDDGLRNEEDAKHLEQMTLSVYQKIDDDHMAHLGNPAWSPGALLHAWEIPIGYFST